MKHPLQQAEFFISAADDAQLPPPGPPEIAFAGRSNAGKSSAINTLANRTRLAFTSKMPGRTQQINLFRLRSGALLADLPGYGYAAVPKELKRHWQQFLARYLATRQSLIGLVLVVDARHGVADLDRQLLTNYLPSGRSVLILLTKMDKLTRTAQQQAEWAATKAIADAFPAHAANVSVVPFSATRRIGLESAEAVLRGWLGLEIDSADAEPKENDERKGKAGQKKKTSAKGKDERSGSPKKERAPRSRGVTGDPKRPA